MQIINTCLLYLFEAEIVGSIMAPFFFKLLLFRWRSLVGSNFLIVLCMRELESLNYSSFFTHGHHDGVGKCTLYRCKLWSIGWKTCVAEIDNLCWKLVGLWEKNSGRYSFCLFCGSDLFRRTWLNTKLIIFSRQGVQT